MTLNQYSDKRPEKESFEIETMYVSDAVNKLMCKFVQVELCVIPNLFYCFQKRHFKLFNLFLFNFNLFSCTFLYMFILNALIFIVNRVKFYYFIFTHCLSFTAICDPSGPQ